MGERLNDTGEPGRRRAHPSAAADALADPAVAALLAGALRESGGAGAGGAGETAAVAAFRAARDTGAHRTARTRRRDDWRPHGRRHTVRSLRATLSAVVASLALGGVAFAAIESSSAPDEDRAGARPPRSASASAGTSGTSSATPSPDVPAGRERPATAKDTAAHCQAYEQVRGRGKAMDSTAWQRLVTAAGGAENVTAYCEAMTASASASASASTGNGKADGSDNGSDNGSTDGSADGGDNGKADGTGTGAGTTETPKAVRTNGKGR